MLNRKNHWVLAIPLLTVFSCAHAASFSYPVSFAGQYYQGVNIDNVTLATLNAKVGDSIRITAPFSCHFSAAWGSLMFSNCKTDTKLTQSVTTCIIAKANAWTNTLSFGLDIFPHAPSSGQGTIVVSTDTKAKHHATIHIHLPKKPAFLKDSALAD